MSKKIIPAVVQTAVRLLVLLALVSPLVQFNSVAQRPVARRIETTTAAVSAATGEVLRETSLVRELPVLRPVKSGAQSRVEIERMIVRNLNEESTPEEMRAAEVSLIRFGLAPAAFKYRPFVIGLLTEQVAGYYDAKQQEFFLADWIELDMQKPIMAHELTHALQDQHFDLRRFEKWPDGDSDAELAAHALIEGDATMAMLRYVARDSQRARALLKSAGDASAQSDLIDSAPRAIRESLLFPYQQGAMFVSQLLGVGGWKRVSRAFTELPQSTEQILHVDRYFAREAPINLTLPDLKSAFGPGWSRIETDVNGEWSYYLILDEYLKSEEQSKRAAEGWGGDIYSVFSGSRPGQVAIVHLSAWDTERDAVEFFDAYGRRTQKRYASAVPARVPVSEAESKRAWRTSEGRVVMERRGNRVLVVEGSPGAAREASILRAIWQ